MTLLCEWESKHQMENQLEDIKGILDIEGEDGQLLSLVTVKSELTQTTEG